MHTSANFAEEKKVPMTWAKKPKLGILVDAHSAGGASPSQNTPEKVRKNGKNGAQHEDFDDSKSAMSDYGELEEKSRQFVNRNCENQPEREEKSETR